MTTQARSESSLTNLVILFYATGGYLAFLAVFITFILWSVGVVIPQTVDSAPLLFSIRSPAAAVLVNLLLIALFGIQHSTMARQRFKTWLTRWMPDAAERATYVWASCAALALVMVGWQPLPEKIWSTEGTVYGVLLTVNIACWLFAIASSWMIDHFDLFGLRQAWNHLRNNPPPRPQFMARFAYRFVRHPLMTGILLGLWVVPVMSWGHLVLSLGMTLYILIGTRIEERDLIRLFGDRYRRYREQVPKLFPRPGTSVERE